MRVLDLFCGAVGGWSIGLSRAGYTTVAACEIDEWRRAVFAYDHPNCRMYGDVRDIDAARLVRDLGQLPDIIVASPPCQDISTANTSGRGIDGERSGLFWEAVRIVGEVRPLWACFENSPRLRLLGYDGLADALEAQGYATWPLVVGARHIGAPHRRGRVWLVAADADRLRLREQPWGSGRANEAGAAELGRDDPDACEPDSVWWGEDRGGERRPQEDVRAWPDAEPDDPYADGEGEYGRAVSGPSLEGWLDQSVADADGAGQASLWLEPELREETHATVGCTYGLPRALAEFAWGWPDWNGGAAGLAAACAAAGAGPVDDGDIPVMASGLRNKAIAALGDAIVPDIAETIGRAMAALMEG